LIQGKEFLVAITDAGGRGAALAEAYGSCPEVDGIVAYPGNDLMRYVTRKPVFTNPKIGVKDVVKILEDCHARGVTLIDVCQDNAVEVGVANAAREAGLATIGHSKEAGILETDKVDSRKLLRKFGLDEFQPEWADFETIEEGIEHLDSQPDKPRFIKAAGLAEGKGALGARNHQIAKDRIVELKNWFPDAAKRYLIEEWLMNDDGTAGEEFSFFALCKDREWKFEGVAEDYKTVYDHDQGENTGGMGCVSPISAMTPEIYAQVEEILDKVVPGMADEVDEETGKSRALSGDLYFSGMIVDQGGEKRVKVVEFNNRFGDPEAQVILPGIISRRLYLALATAGHSYLINGLADWSDMRITRDNLTRVTVAGTSLGYPLDYKAVKGKQIHGLASLLHDPDITVYGAGVEESDDVLKASGGRLFYLTAAGENIIEARSKAYGAMSKVSIDGHNLHYRTDIGHREMARYYNS
jgi:phosphoribosylamine---glycine ligase